MRTSEDDGTQQATTQNAIIIYVRLNDARSNAASALRRRIQCCCPALQRFHCWCFTPKCITGGCLVLCSSVHHCRPALLRCHQLTDCSLVLFCITDCLVLYCALLSASPPSNSVALSPANRLLLGGLLHHRLLGALLFSPLHQLVAVLLPGATTVAFGLVLYCVVSLLSLSPFSIVGDWCSLLGVPSAIGDCCSLWLSHPLLLLLLSLPMRWSLVHLSLVRFRLR